jgi:hypothetical protein
MQCVEFETRLNDLLDERLLPAGDAALVEHARDCAVCSELLAAHDVLLEGVQALPAIWLGDAARQTLAHRVAVEVGSVQVGSAPARPFPVSNESVGDKSQMELAAARPATVATISVAPLAVIGLVLATAAALLIAVLPWFRPDQQPAPSDGQQSIVETKQVRPLDSPVPGLAVTGYDTLAPIARVGYQVADGLTPVTSSMVSALRELRKRPFFRGADEQGRSSFYAPQQSDVLTA